MNEDRRFEQTARQFLEQGPTEAPAAPIRAALLTIQTTPQARDLGFRLPSPRFVAPLRLAMAAAIAIVAVVGIGLRLPTTNVGMGPTPSVMATPTPTPLDTTGWVTFTSERYGYTVRHPDVWEAAHATGFWTLDNWKDQYLTELSADVMAGDLSNSKPCTYEENTCGYPSFSGWSLRLPAGMSEIEFLAIWSAPDAPKNPQCVPSPDQMASVLIGGQAGRVAASACGLTALAFLFVGTRAYVFEMEDRVNYPDGPLFRTMLSTVEVHPEDALDPPSPEPSASPAQSATPVESPAST
ncbi:MAG TPA: hypothetical protein VEX41_06985 [Candidatus Eisenbacteria bacterium]|nr:hypothetical protein [Candidatus Eisenbacteria bacterium]